MGGACCKGEGAAEDENGKVADIEQLSSEADGRRQPMNGEGLDDRGSFERPNLEGEDGSGFRAFSLDELIAATAMFSEQNIVSEGGRQAVNVVYRGRLKGARGGPSTQIAVKRFSKREWENAAAFVNEAQKIGRINHPCVTYLLGYCCDGDDRLLVSDFIPNSTLAQHLFHWEHSPMPWTLRLKVAAEVASALHYLESVGGFPAYHDLNPYRILFTKDMQPKLSCFGLLKPMRDGRFSSNLPNAPPELFMTGMVTSRTVVYMFGSLLLALFSGKIMRPLQFVELAANKHDMTTILDSQLVGKPGVDQALELVPLIVECLQNAPDKRPSIDRISEFLLLLQTGGYVPDSLAAQIEDLKVIPDTGITFKAAAMTHNYDQLYKILCSDDFNPAMEPSFEAWNAEMQAALSYRQRGSAAFQRRKWDDAVASFTKYIDCGAPAIPVIYARRAVAFMQLSKWQEALKDAEEAAVLKPGWSEATCLQAACLHELGMESTAHALFASVAEA